MVRWGFLRSSTANNLLLDRMYEGKQKSSCGAGGPDSCDEEDWRSCRFELAKFHWDILFEMLIKYPRNSWIHKPRAQERVGLERERPRHKHKCD